MIALLALALAAAPAEETESLTAVRDSYPHLSPDGKTLAFLSNRSGRQAIWVAGPDGADPRMLFDGGSIGERPSTPVWSPDGTAIAFGMAPGGASDPNESEIYVMRADGSGARRLTEAPGDDSHPHWSADGRRIFFNSARATPDLKAEWTRQWIDIYSMESDGSDVRRHTDCRAVCTYPVPSPNGRFVAHRRTLPTPGLDWELRPQDRNSEVFATALDGSGSVNLSRSPAYDGWPIWSPGGRWVVFASNRDGTPSTAQIFAVRPDGSGLRPLTSGHWSRTQPSFAGSGRLLVYESLERSPLEIGHIAGIAVALPD